jgi:hypothetical protein
MTFPHGRKPAVLLASQPHCLGVLEPRAKPAIWSPISLSLTPHPGSASGYAKQEMVGTACYCRDCSSASARTRKLLFGSIGEPDELPCC